MTQNVHTETRCFSTRQNSLNFLCWISQWSLCGVSSGGMQGLTGRHQGRRQRTIQGASLWPCRGTLHRGAFPRQDVTTGIRARRGTETSLNPVYQPCCMLCQDSESCHNGYVIYGSYYYKWESEKVWWNYISTCRDDKVSMLTHTYPHKPLREI